MKTVLIHTEYITLGQFLKYINEISSGAMAKLFLSEGKVKVNGEVETRRGRKLYPGYVINIESKQYQIGKNV
jgi:ribosome-associated protein